MDFMNIIGQCFGFLLLVGLACFSAVSLIKISKQEKEREKLYQEYLKTSIEVNKTVINSQCL